MPVRRGDLRITTRRRRMPNPRRPPARRFDATRRLKAARRRAAPVEISVHVWPGRDHNVVTSLRDGGELHDILRRWCAHNESVSESAACGGNIVVGSPAPAYTDEG